MPSLTARPVGFAAPEGYRLANPSVALHGGRIVLLQPTVEQRHPTRTRDFLLQFSEELAVQSSAEVLAPPETPEPGLQDPRLFAWRDGLWCCARVVTLATEEGCEQLLACVDDQGPGPTRLTPMRLLRVRWRHQQHWMPLVKLALGEAGAEGLELITGCDPTRVVDDEARPILETTPAIAAEQFDGATPAIDFDACPWRGTGRGWLALIHETEMREGEQYDWHRWVWFDQASVLRGVSPPFYFGKKGIERAAGLTPHPDGRHLLISYGIGDGEAWLATVDAGDVRKLLEDAEHLCWG
jgi:hypothetical protein